MASNSNEDRLMTIASRSLDLFLRRGYEETTMRMIQDATGLHSGSIYYVVNGKEGILLMVSEGFIGDIMCRSSRIAREMDDPRLNILLPPAFLLYSSAASGHLSRLLAQMFRTDSTMGLIVSMAAEWGSRVDVPEGMDLPSSLSFVYGGLGAIMREGMGLTDGMSAMAPFLSPLVGEVDADTLERICGIVGEEGLRFYDMDITTIDSEME